MKLTQCQLPHIDNNFFVISSSQARKLSIDGKLPRAGYAKKADANLLAGLQCGKIKGEELPRGELRFSFTPFRNAVLTAKSEGWIQATPLSWFNDEPVKSGFVYALHITKY